MTNRVQAVVPARTCMLISVNVDTADNVEGSIEPNGAGYQPLLIARSVNKITNLSTVMEITKITNEAVIIPRDWKLVTFEPLCNVCSGQLSVPMSEPVWR